MAEGNKYFVQEQDMGSNYGKGVKLLDNVTYNGVDSVYKGGWYPISTLKNATVQVKGTDLTGNVNIEGSNEQDPQPDSDGFALCTALTASGLSVLTKMPVRFVRATVTSFSAGSVSAHLHGVA